MKRLLNIALVAGLLAGVVSCQEDAPAPGKIEMEFQFDALDIDLNVSDNPYVICVINSEQELSSVSMFIVRKDGTEEAYKSPVTDFYKPTLCTIHERPIYDADMAAFKVVAKDIGGTVLSKSVSLTINPLVTAPVLSFSAESLKFAEGDPIPAFGFTVEAHSPLVTVTVELVESGTLTELVSPLEVFSDPMKLTFSSGDFALTDYDLNKIPSAIRVTATDSYGKKGIFVLPIDYKALPSPELTVESMADVNEFAACTVSGTASSETGITEISAYAVGTDYECPVGTKAYDTAGNCSFSINIDGNEIRDYVTGIKVVAKDARNKTATSVVPLKVSPKLWELSPSDNLLAVISEQQDDPKFRTIKLGLPSDGVYDLGSNSYTITKSLVLVGMGENPATVKSSASYTFLTSGAVVDSVSFSNVKFTSGKSGAGMFNNSGGCNIGSISARNCVFEGSYSGAYIRLGGGCVIGSITVDDCIVKWANTSGSFSFFHMTQSSDKVARLRLTNSTISGVYYLWYCNIGSNTIEAEISNNTFVNQKGSANGYFVSFTQSTHKGSLFLKKNLFGGSNNIKGAYRMLRANAISAVTEDNWCTKSWKTFSDDSTNGSVNFLTILPDSEDNDDIFTDLDSFDLTLKGGTSVRTAGIGDPRWLK